MLLRLVSSKREIKFRSLVSFVLGGNAFQIRKSLQVGKMEQGHFFIGKGLQTPRAAAIAGMLFCVLLITSQLLVWISIPANPGAIDVISHSRTVSLALNLLPFAGIAFLWFIGVVRNRLGMLEDRFFATVFLGSGLLYIAMIFMSAALAGGLIRVLINTPESPLQTGTYVLGRAQVYQTMNVYGIKMAGVFMFSTSTILLRTRIVQRWIPLLGYALGAILLLSIGVIVWIPLVFPIWVFLLSAAILLENPSGRGFQGERHQPTSGGAAEIARETV
jgi:hypothetical protein